MILHSLRSNASKSGKEMILALYSNEQHKKMFQYAYDVEKRFYLKFKTIDWDNIQEPDDELFNTLDMLANREVTGNNARYMVENHAELYGDLIKLICNKDLDCGVNASTLNKVFGKGFIFVFELQLAEEMPLAKVKLPVVSQLKYDGVRVIARVEKGEVKLRTRNGLPFNYPFLEEALAELKGYYGDVVLDGELIIESGATKDRTTVTGIVNSALKGTPILETHNITFCVFDGMFCKEFDTQSCDRAYHARYAHISQIIGSLQEANKYAHEHLKLSQNYEVDTLEDLEKAYANVIEQGYEGLILKHWDHLYTFKRTRDWTKVKAIDPATLDCVGYVGGEGKYQGQIGALLLEGTVKGKFVKVKVGSGLSDSDRAKNPDEYVGHKVDILYNTIVQDKDTKEFSLFLPRNPIVRGDL